MDEALCEWKVHFNIRDAAYLALRNILTHHWNSLGDSQCALVDAGSLQREPPQLPRGTYGHDWLTTTAEAESLVLGSSTFGDSQLINQFEFHFPVVNTGQQPQTYTSDDDHAMESSMSCIQGNLQLSSGTALENDSVAPYLQDSCGSAPHDVRSDWTVYSNAANQWDASFLQDQRSARELGSLSLLPVGTFEPWLSTTNRFRPDLHPSTPPDENQSNCKEVKKTACRRSTKQTSKRKLGTSDPSAPDRPTKRILACVRCWITKKKASGHCESGYPNTNASAYIL